MARPGASRLQRQLRTPGAEQGLSVLRVLRALTRVADQVAPDTPACSLPVCPLLRPHRGGPRSQWSGGRFATVP